MNFAAEFSKFAGDKLGRSMLLDAEFWMGMQVLPPGGHFAVKQNDEMWNLHGEQLRNKPTQMLRPDSR
jgi:hypothetical protein